MFIGEWSDKVVYYAGGFGAAVGTFLDDINVLTLLSIIVMVVVGGVSVACHIVRTVAEVRYRRKRLQMLDSLNGGGRCEQSPKDSNKRSR